jgi:RHS repeat-associated protein
MMAAPAAIKSGKQPGGGGLGTLGGDLALGQGAGIKMPAIGGALVDPPADVAKSDEASTDGEQKPSNLVALDMRLMGDPIVSNRMPDPISATSSSTADASVEMMTASRERELLPTGLVEGAATWRSAIYHYHVDPNGCPTRVTCGDGEVVWSANYSGWGRASESSSKINSFLRYQGQYYDQETCLHYNRYRYYDSTAGCFLSIDPLGFLAGDNLYNFGKNTIGWMDPLGLTVEKLTGDVLWDRIAREVDAAASFAEKALDRGITRGTQWGKIYQEILAGNERYANIPVQMARGNAIQQMADVVLSKNHYMQHEAQVQSNRGHMDGLKNARGNTVRPDYQARLKDGRVGIIDITTSGQRSKISKYGSVHATNAIHGARNASGGEPARGSC